MLYCQIDHGMEYEDDSVIAGGIFVFHDSHGGITIMKHDENEVLEVIHKSLPPEQALDILEDIHENDSDIEFPYEKVREEIENEIKEKGMDHFWPKYEDINTYASPSDPSRYDGYDSREEMTERFQEYMTVFLSYRDKFWKYQAKKGRKVPSDFIKE